MAATPFDALIIGSGQAGNPLATALAAAGHHVALIEDNRLGGSCINYGCSPTKTLLATAERLHQLRTAAVVAAPEHPHAADLRVNLAAAVARKDAVVGEMRNSVRTNLTKKQKNITLFEGHAAFTAPRSLRVALADGGTQDLTAPLIFINTGTRAAIP